MIEKLPKSLLLILRFFKRVASRFFKNKGILLAGAVGYNTLLSLIPLFAILLVLLSRVFDEALILSAVETELRVIVPGQADTIVDSLKKFLKERNVISAAGLGVLLFFSSIAFRILEDAMKIIFHTDKPKPRHPVIAAILPYLYVGLMGLGLIALTIVTGILDGLSESPFLFGAIGTYQRYIVQFLGFLGLTLMLTSIYLVMPPVRVQFRRAIAGGAIAALLWEVVRNIMVWYFENLSLVGVVYGSLATVIIVLLSMEVAAIIILLGAQVIAEIERSDRANVPWYRDPDIVRREAEPDDDPIKDLIEHEAVSKAEKVAVKAEKAAAKAANKAAKAAQKANSLEQP